MSEKYSGYTEPTEMGALLDEVLRETTEEKLLNAAIRDPDESVLSSAGKGAEKMDSDPEDEFNKLFRSIL